MRGCSEKILNLYRDSYSVTGLAKPNAFLNSVTALTNFRTENLKKKKKCSYRLRGSQKYWKK